MTSIHYEIPHEDKRNGYLALGTVNNALTLVEAGNVQAACQLLCEALLELAKGFLQPRFRAVD